MLFVHTPVRGQGIVYEVFGAYLDSLREQAGIPGLAAAIVDQKGIVWERAYGWQDIGRAIATRMDTPFAADGLTQIFTAVMLLECAEDGQLSLDDRIGSFVRVPANTPEPNATIRQFLTHTSGSPENLTYARRLDRLEPLTPIVRTCAVDSFRETFTNLLARLAMIDSVPGADIERLPPRAEGIPKPEELAQYQATLRRRAMPYAVDSRGRAVLSSYPPNTDVLSPGRGLITTVRDLAFFDRDLRNGVLVGADMLAEAWSVPVGGNGEPLPHGLGWYVQNYKGEKVVWQYGMTEDAASSLIVTLPARQMTLILMANSDGLLKLFSPSRGDVSRSPFARLFLNLFVR